jgi:Uma2 family endonuclease
MRLPEKPSGRLPDLLVILDEHKDRLGENYLDGPADIVIEIVSEESQARDRGEKFAEYEAAGIPEYWLIDPLRDHADFYRLNDQGRYTWVALDADGRFHSAVLPGLYLNPNWLWADELPNLAQTLEMVRAMLA